MASDSGSRYRILHVFSTFAVGGPQVRFTQLLRHFDPQWRHLLLAMDGRYDCLSMLADGSTVETIERPEVRGGLPGRLLGYRRAFATLKPDILVTYNWGATEWALAASLPRRIRQMHVADGFGPEEVERQLPRRVWFRRLALSGCETLLVPSLTLQRIARDIWRIPERKIAYVPNGIDCAAFAGEADPGLVPTLPAERAGPVIGTVATLRAEKNIGRMIRAFAKARETMPGLSLVVAGDGPEKEGLQRLTQEAGLAEAVHFPGRIEKPEKLVGLFDILALSSDTEQMPISVIEAMAAGLPVAGLAVGDVADIVAPANRPYIAAAGDEAGLAAAMLALAGDETLRHNVGEANRAHVRVHYAEDSMAAAWAKLLGPARA